MRQRSWCGARAMTLGWLALVTMTGGVLVCTHVSTPEVVFAQEPDVPAPADDAVDDDEVIEELADVGEAPPVQENVPVDADQEPPAGNQKSYLEIAWAALGWQYSLVFLGLSFTLVALLVMNLLTARRDNVCPSVLIDEFEEHLNEKRYQEAYDLAKADESFLGQVLSAGLAKLSAGYPQAIEAMQEVGEEENMKLEHRLSYMALIGTISPMVGLFGTVQGMIASFRVIAESTGAPKHTELAEGISTALFTTLVGLGIAIPAIAAYNILKNRIARLVLEVGIMSEGLMARFENVGPKKK